MLLVKMVIVLIIILSVIWLGVAFLYCDTECLYAEWGTYLFPLQPEANGIKLSKAYRTLKQNTLSIILINIFSF